LDFSLGFLDRTPSSIDPAEEAAKEDDSQWVHYIAGSGKPFLDSDARKPLRPFDSWFYFKASKLRFFYENLQYRTKIAAASYYSVDPMVCVFFSSLDFFSTSF